MAENEPDRGAQTADAGTDEQLEHVSGGPSSVVECRECTTPYPMELDTCPHCGRENDFLVGDGHTEPVDTESVTGDENVTEPRRGGTTTVHLPDDDGGTEALTQRADSRESE